MDPWYVRFNDIGTPIIALIGFWFLGKQIEFSQRQADGVEKQVQLMSEQMKQGTDLTKATNLPYLSITEETIVTPDTISWRITLKNSGLSPAFQIRVHRTQQDDSVQTDNIVEFDALSQGEASTKFVFVELPLGYRGMQQKLIVEYKNVFGDDLTQVWEARGEHFKLIQPPQLQRTVTSPNNLHLDSM